MGWSLEVNRSLESFFFKRWKNLQGVYTRCVSQIDQVKMENEWPPEINDYEFKLAQ